MEEQASVLACKTAGYRDRKKQQEEKQKEEILGTHSSKALHSDMSIFLSSQCNHCQRKAVKKATSLIDGLLSWELIFCWKRALCPLTSTALQDGCAPHG